MARFLGSVTQGGADTAASSTIDTGITVDGKTGISIFAMEIFWDNGESVAAADWEMNAVLSTVNSAPGVSSADEICRISWGMQNTAGVAVATPYEPLKQLIMVEPRITVQPVIYLLASSTLTGQANTIRYRIYYEAVKLSDLEVMRLLVGGA
jgi:hypothetical protein